MRVSLTKAQRRTSAGVELLALCQSVTEDGQLTRDEVRELGRWLDEHRHEDLPAIEFLVTTIEAILEDGRITPEESKSLYKAIERVLPPELRKDTADRRRTRERSEREQLRAEKERKKQEERERREMARPIGYADALVAGSMFEDRPQVVKQFVRQGQIAYLVRDRSNAYSRNAIEVRAFNGRQIGYVPEVDAVTLAPLLDAGAMVDARIKKILSGGRSPIPIVVAKLYRADASIPGAVRETDVPAKPSDSLPASSGCGCTGCLAFMVGTAAVLAVLL